MSEFLVETYAPREPTGTRAWRAAEVALAADQVSQPGAGVRLLGAILVPEDDVAFYVFRSSSARAVREAMSRAGLECERVTQAVLTEIQSPAFSRGGRTNDPCV